MHRRRKRDIIIELTSLLDVIMIMIFMVMSENSKFVSNVQSELGTAQQENIEQAGEIDDLTAQLAEALGKLAEGEREELLERLQNAESELEGYQAMDDVVTILNVHLENQYNHTGRRLTFGTSDDMESIPAHNNDEFNTAVNKLRLFISEHTKQISVDDSDTPTIYIVFSYNPNTVFQRDYAVINDILEKTEIKASSTNLRYRPNPIS